MCEGTILTAKKIIYIHRLSPGREINKGENVKKDANVSTAINKLSMFHIFNRLI